MSHGYLPGHAVMLHRDNKVYRVISTTDAPHNCIRIRDLKHVQEHSAYVTETVHVDDVDGVAPMFNARVVG